MNTNLLGMSRRQLQEYFVSIGEKPFRAVQLLKWIHARGIVDFADMTDMSKDLRHRLQEQCTITTPQVISEHVASDETRKWLMAVPGGSLIETVYIPEQNRGTLCISSQVGCALNCSFCSTARQGYQRDLSSAEIIGQLWVAQNRLGQVVDAKLSTKVTNVVMMGMGEPLLNFDNVRDALAIMRDDQAYNLPRRRVTVSTSGVVPNMERLIAEMDVALAVSLHAPNNELRNELVPINKKYNIATLLAACKRYTNLSPRHSVTMEYVMLDGVNDSDEHAKQLAKILAPVRCKVNLIPFNPFPGAPYVCTSPEKIRRFSRILSNAGVVSTTRKTRGEDIDAACGQLVGKVLDRTRRSQKFKADYAAKFKEQPNVTENNYA